MSFTADVNHGDEPRFIADPFLGRSLSATFGANVLVTDRVNAGTVFFVGYDDRYQQGDRLGGMKALAPAYQRTNRAMFTTLQYLFRYQYEARAAPEA